jgi:hypothetical protein
MKLVGYFSDNLEGSLLSTRRYFPYTYLAGGRGVGGAVPVLKLAIVQAILQCSNSMYTYKHIKSLYQSSEVE